LKWYDDARVVKPQLGLGSMENDRETPTSVTFDHACLNSVGPFLNYTQ